MNSSNVVVTDKDKYDGVIIAADEADKNKIDTYKSFPQKTYVQNDGK